MLLLALSSPAVKAQDTIKSSVSPEFLQGLHAKYLHFIAHQSNLHLQIIPMPFARRVTALRHGKIDIMVGLKDGHQENEEFVYLKPSYSIDKGYFFILAKNHGLMTGPADMEDKLIGVTIDEHRNLKPEGRSLNGAKLIPVNSLQQKIDMLLLGRTDMFRHFLNSTQRALTNQGFKDKIVLAQYQLPEETHYYFALSTKSPFFAKRRQFEAFIAKELEKGSFQNIMAEHYRSLDKKRENTSAEPVF